MGTSYLVRTSGLPEGLTSGSLQLEIAAELERINTLMSVYRPDSEISCFNRHTGGDLFGVSPDTARVVSEAQLISRASGGAFDVTVGPLVDLWSFGPGRRTGAVPGADEIARALSTTGFGNLEVRESPPALRKSLDALRIDLSAIAKGYAVDRIFELLLGKGIDGFLVEIGGEIRTSGRREDGSRWRVGIEAPADDVREVFETLSVGDCALASSGDYRRFFEKDGVRYSHTIDPRTGRPVEHSLASVTVFAASCMEADAWATALMVLGPNDGYELAADLNLAALFFIRVDDGFRQKATPRFDETFPGISASVESEQNPSRARQTR